MYETRIFKKYNRGIRENNLITGIIDYITKMWYNKKVIIKNNMKYT